MRIGLVVVVAVLAFLTSGCAAESKPSISGDDLFQEYIRSGDVKNDRFPGGGSGEDRIANLASRWSAEEFVAILMGTYTCDDSQVATRCEVTGEATTAARDFAGADAEILGRSILVKHGDGSLEMVTLYVVEGPSDQARLIDKNGGTYTDLEDFRANNDLLTADDTMLTLRDITAVPGEGGWITVTGHTPSSVWPWWVGGGIAAVGLLGIVIVLRRRTAARDAAEFRAYLESQE
jgi:hypothetical protein